MASFVGYRVPEWDENQMSVPCRALGCPTRVYRDVRCHRHGGDPDYEWTTSIYGETVYTIKKEGADAETSV